MKVKTRFSLLIGLLCLGFGGSFLTLWLYEQHETAMILKDISRQRSELLDRLVTLTGASLEQFANDYSVWTEMADFVDEAKPNLNWAEINIDNSLDNFDVQTAWVLKPDGTVFYRVVSPARNRRTAPALPPIEGLLELLHREKYGHFFMADGGDIYEVRAESIHPSADAERHTPPHGFLLAARHWDQAHLADLAKLAQGEVELTSYIHNSASPVVGKRIHLHRVLRDWRNQPLRIMHVDYDSPELTRISETDNWEAAIFCIYGATAIVLVAFCGWYWVLRPLAQISESLTAGSLRPIEKLSYQRSELGRVAKLVQAWFNDREELRQTLDERARLGRDLHDGVIQTLYASGMSLSSARAILRRDPGGAEDLLDQTHAEINATIRDVRNFLVRLEPVALEQRQFRDAVQSLADFMHALRPARFKIEVDDTMAAALPMEMRAQLLHFLREALSNALRHGAADNIQIHLRRRDAGGELVVQDNGVGFDPASVTPGGHGLENFAERAREMSASLDIRSQPGHGTVITLRFPFPPRA